MRGVIVDWTNTKRKDRFTYELVDPNNLEATRGYIDGVTSCKITFGYYTDTRISGSLTAYGIRDQWRENSLIRVHHFVDGSDFHEEICTCFVSELGDGWEHNTDSFDMQLKSMLWRLEDDLLTSNLTLAKGSYAKKALQDIFNSCGAAYSIDSDVGNHQYGKATVYEAGKSRLSTAFDLCDTLGARLEVDGHGTIRVRKYVAPSQKPSRGIIDGEMIYGSIDRTDNFATVPNVILVTHKKGDKTIVGRAEVSGASNMAYAKRGRRVVELHEESDMKPETAKRANELAKKYLDNNGSIVTYSMNQLYQPIDTGDVYMLRFSDADHRCMLQTRDLDIGTGMLCNDVWRVV